MTTLCSDTKQQKLPKVEMNINTIVENVEGKSDLEIVSGATV